MTGKREPDKHEISMIDSIGIFADKVPKRRSSGMLRWFVTFCIGVGISETMPDTPVVLIVFLVWFAGNLARHFWKRNKRYRMIRQNITVRDITLTSLRCPLEEARKGRNLTCHARFTDKSGKEYEVNVRIGASNILAVCPAGALLVSCGDGSEEAGECWGIVPAFPRYAEYLRKTYDYQP